MMKESDMRIEYASRENYGMYVVYHVWRSVQKERKKEDRDREEE